MKPLYYVVVENARYDYSSNYDGIWKEYDTMEIALAAIKELEDLDIRNDEYVPFKYKIMGVYAEISKCDGKVICCPYTDTEGGHVVI